MNEYRQNAINHLKTHLGCVGYRDYLIAELKKLERIEQITDGITEESNPMVIKWNIKEVLDIIEEFQTIEKHESEE